VEIDEDYLISSDEDGNSQAIQKNTVNVEENPRTVPFSDTVEIPPVDFQDTENKIVKTGVKHEFEAEKCPERYLKRRKKSATEMLIDFLRSEDFLEYTRNTVLEGSRTLKNLCSPKDLHSRIKDIVDAEPLATQLIQILSRDIQSQTPEIIQNSVWTLTNLSYLSTKHTNLIINQQQLFDTFHKNWHSYSIIIKTQIYWLFSNLIGESNEIRDYLVKKTEIIRKFILPQLNDHLENSKTGGSAETGVNELYQRFIENLLWMCTNLMRNLSKTYEPIKQELRKVIYPCCYLLKTYARRLHQPATQELVVNLSWVICFASEDPNGSRNLILDTNILRTLVDMLYHPVLKNSVKSALVRTLGNFCSGTETETQEVIKSSAIPALYELLSGSGESNGISNGFSSGFSSVTHGNGNLELNGKIRKEIVWIFSNIAAGNSEQILHLVKSVNGKLFRYIVQLSQNAEDRVRKEALYTITSALNGSKPEDVESRLLQVQDNGSSQISIVTSLVFAIDSTDPELVLLGLDGIKSLLKHGDSLSSTNYKNNYVNPFVGIVEEADALDRIEKLQNYENEMIYKTAFEVIDTWFCDSDAEEDSD